MDSWWMDEWIDGWWMGMDGWMDKQILSLADSKVLELGLIKHRMYNLFVRGI